MDITTWIIFCTNFPDSSIDSHKSFQLHLIDELTTPLLDLMASTDCPPHLQDARGKKIVTADKRLVGKIIAYKHAKRGRCVVCGQKKGPKGKQRDTKT